MGEIATLGVEEEFLLVDRRTRRPVADAGPVLADASATRAELKHELLLSQVEAASAVCTDAEDLRSQLRQARRALARSARGHGDRLVSVGLPPLPGASHTATGDRFERIDRRYAGIVRDYQACGCHVHVGVPDRETAVAVVDRLGRWLPTLLALSANSPYHEGRDTGHASWRAVLQARFPGFGVAPVFGSADRYDAAVDRLVDCGVLIDRQMSFWLARPSEHLPTVEVRAADAAGTVDEAVLLAVLVRALVRMARRDAEAGVPAAHLPPELASAAVWAAARHGLDGPGVAAGRGRSVPGAHLLTELVRYAGPALAEAGDGDVADDALARLLQAGTGARRLRQASRRLRLPGLVDWLATQTVDG
ncbi:MAG TPA: glutamate--cysteine ligase [Actinocatenispora sp.]